MPQPHAWPGLARPGAAASKCVTLICVIYADEASLLESSATAHRYIPPSALFAQGSIISLLTRDTLPRRRVGVGVQAITRPRLRPDGLPDGLTDRGSPSVRAGARVRQRDARRREKPTCAYKPICECSRCARKAYAPRHAPTEARGKLAHSSLPPFPFPPRAQHRAASQTLEREKTSSVFHLIAASRRYHLCR